MSEFWGKHYLLDCKSCVKFSIKSRSNIEYFVKALVEKIDMKAYGDPIIEHFATHDPAKGGFTLCQMIETSLIDGHFVDETGDAYISVHSCKDFDNEVVKHIVNHYFSPISIKETVIFRQA
jgi:hypothetical protein